MVDSVAVDNLMSPAKMQYNSFMVRFHEKFLPESFEDEKTSTGCQYTNSPIMKSYIVLRGKVFTYDQKACSV